MKRARLRKWNKQGKNQSNFNKENLIITFNKTPKHFIEKRNNIRIFSQNINAAIKRRIKTYPNFSKVSEISCATHAESQ